VATAADFKGFKNLHHLPPLSEEDWTLEAEFRGVQRLIGAMKGNGAAECAAQTGHDASPLIARTKRGDHDTSEVAGMDRPKGNFFAWSILSLGLAVFACGAVLLGWAVVAQREDLWPVGMPLAVIGQAGLLLGLILQLDGLWHSSRKTASALSQLDGELTRVRQATTLLSTSRSSAGQSFYAHLAEGASPHLLLCDLKGQLDLLAQQMGRK
jgi:hypothetical protein